MTRIIPTCGTLLALILGAGLSYPQEPLPVAASGAQPTKRDDDVLQFREQVVVTAGKADQKVGELPVQVTVMSREQIRRSPSQTVADMLSEVPSFTTTRTATSRIATPASTPAALRNLGGGSASRALVLVDGVPLNDPFFGFIPWSLVPRAGVERVELVPAAGAGAWGNQALGGAINIITKRPERTSVDVDTRFGSLGTVDLDLGAAYVRGPFSVTPRVSYFESDGYIALGEAHRGPIDTPSSSRTSLFGTRLEYRPSATSRWSLDGSYLDDDRSTGTPLSLDSVEIATARAGGDFATAGGGSLRLGVFGQWRQASSLRGTVNRDRTAATPNRNQFDIPSSSLGLGVSWARPVSQGHMLSVGADVQRTEGEVHDDSRYVQGHYTRRGTTGGNQVMFGVYAQDTLLLGPRWRAVAGARLDLWHAFEGRDFLQNLDTGEVLKDEQFASRDVWVLDPNLGLVYKASERLGLRGSVYRTFRAPTPNELYRTAQAGTRAINQANALLEPERINVGVDAGFDYALAARATLRASGFWNDFRNSINDVTVGVAGALPEEIEPCGLLPPGGLCRQKQNLDRVRHRGAEVELRYRPMRDVSLAGAYVYGHAVVTEAANAPQLVGKRLRRTPIQQASLRAEFSDPRLFTTSLLTRYFGDRYADDTNDRHIGDSVVVDLTVSRRLSDKLELYAIAENLFDTAFQIDNSGDGIEYGHPRLLHVGVRLNWEGRSSSGTGR